MVFSHCDFAHAAHLSRKNYVVIVGLEHVNPIENLERLLKGNDLFFVDGKLSKNKIIELALRLDPELMTLLYSDEQMNEIFFVDVNGIVIFDKLKFQNFVSLTGFLPNSYTQFKKKIGLVNSENFIVNDNRIILNWPYKDCVLEGGQTKEEKEQRQEIFWNGTVAPEEVSRLLSPKAFRNFAKYDLNKQQESPKHLNLSKDNFVIKGNNLLALHSLLPRFSGKVKLVYADVPYNTGSDSFSYNDAFNHSSWLTFMLNRLQVVKELLSSDGIICIQCDDNEQAYLKVLMDEIFGQNNFLNVITVKTKIAGVSGGHIRDATEFINVYAKNKNAVNLNDVYTSDPIYNFVKKYEAEGKSWKYTSVITKLSGKKFLKEMDGIRYYSYESFESQSVSSFAESNGITQEEVYKKHNSKIFQTTNAQSSVAKTVQKETKDCESEIISIEYTPIKGKNAGKEIELFYKGKSRRLLIFLSEHIQEIQGTPHYCQKITTLWDDIQYNNLAKEGGVSFPNGKKPETLIKRIIDWTTNENDLVLDFVLGSGTTAAVCHKMQRQYIGIEQMDYGQNDAISRLRNVIQGDPTGISERVGWKGGGSFILLELAKENMRYIQMMENATDLNELLSYWDLVKDEAKLTYSLDTSAKFSDDSDFKELSLDEQKRVIIETLDYNHLYIPYSEMSDTTHDFSDNEKHLTKLFYGDYFD